MPPNRASFFMVLSAGVTMLVGLFTLYNSVRTQTATEALQPYKVAILESKAQRQERRLNQLESQGHSQAIVLESLKMTVEFNKGQLYHIDTKVDKIADGMEALNH